jgi:heme-degrading monooxygenase HmoA
MKIYYNVGLSIRFGEKGMILEVAILDIIQGMEAAYEDAFLKAKDLISAQPGFISLQLQKCIETGNRYLLQVQWETLEDHIEGFRQSASFQQWKELLYHFYDPFPTVEHYQTIF